MSNETPAEVATLLHDLAKRMKDAADAMWRLDHGIACDGHAAELQNAARMVVTWAHGLEEAK